MLLIWQQTEMPEKDMAKAKMGKAVVEKEEVMAEDPLPISRIPATSAAIVLLVMI